MSMASLGEIRYALDPTRAARKLWSIFSVAPEPLSAWRLIPRQVLDSISPTEAKGFISALLPIVRDGREVELFKLRRLYQLFAMMGVSAACRRAFVDALYTRLNLEPKELPTFASRETADALWQEASYMAGRLASAQAQAYLERLRAHLCVSEGTRLDARLGEFLDWLTELENRAAQLLSKEGHVVKPEERRKEIFKKLIAYVGVPLGVIYPLGVVGLSTEGIVTGLAALGSFGLAAAGTVSAAPVMAGLVVLAALAGTSKKLLDMIIPTTDSDKVSAEVERVLAAGEKLRRAYERTPGSCAPSEELERAYTEALELIKSLVPKAEQARRAYLLELGRRYLEMLACDEEALGAENHLAADDLARLRSLDAKLLD